MDFVSVANMKYIVGILQDYFTEKYSIDLAKVALQINLKAIVHTEMVRAAKLNVGVNDKNKEVFKQCIPVVLNAAQSLRQAIPQQSDQIQYQYQNTAQHVPSLQHQQQPDQFQGFAQPNDQQYPSFGAMQALEPAPNGSDYAAMVRDIQKQREELTPDNIPLSTVSRKTLTFLSSAKDISFTKCTIESIVLPGHDTGILFLRHSSCEGTINTPFGGMFCVLDAFGKVTYGGDITDSGTITGITKIGGEIDLSDIPCFVWV